MTTDLVKKCARAICAKRDVDPDELHDFGSGQLMAWALVAEDVETVIDALADGVTDEMVRAGDEAFTGLLIPVDSELKAFLVAAIRAAKSREG